MCPDYVKTPGKFCSFLPRVIYTLNLKPDTPNSKHVKKWPFGAFGFSLEPTVVRLAGGESHGH